MPNCAPTGITKVCPAGMTITSPGFAFVKAYCSPQPVALLTPVPGVVSVAAVVDGVQVVPPTGITGGAMVEVGQVAGSEGGVGSVVGVESPARVESVIEGLGGLSTPAATAVT